MNKQTIFAGTIVFLFIAGVFILGDSPSGQDEHGISGVTKTALAAKFEDLSQNGNSSCSGGFKESIAAMPSEAHLKGSCCSPMSLHRYSEQVEGLEKFKSVPGQDINLIPNNPYDIEVGLAQEFIGYYDLILTPEEQAAYDYAMLNSNERGPCCCQCWRWYVYGGLGKYLIQNHGFTGEQLTELWNLSDGCGGDSEHRH
ncbi:MAG: hypothetical protein COU90_01740 [Candidatus Ryanbacteria bacterium CG10_big_fil_rev_8_21_14_0_10_43_42]|uniref:Uncharacterized protein n=1 Tax=Candidatus Ryanbacteria bacterium CG10_big_fil_rev_8_21_14_0_10_43_42 TaxID=1974864 RepID=A0A2M8KXD6_9BACT|nr:MAG: hypothetical protein COU90_01740 [Candidatus Ryanbacteria bacterium CG10_big_fil_rev_8_21_14_0_10_43_42]